MEGHTEYGVQVLIQCGESIDDPVKYAMIAFTFGMQKVLDSIMKKFIRRDQRKIRKEIFSSGKE